jgi:hypothetical protein
MRRWKARVTGSIGSCVDDATSFRSLFITSSCINKCIFMFMDHLLKNFGINMDTGLVDYRNG